MVAWQLVKWVAALAFPGSLLGAEEPWRPPLFIAAAAFVLIFAFWRYAERRSKAILQAYWFVLTDSYRGEAASPAAPAAPDGLTHAGGVVLRYRGGRLPEYLRVEAQGAPGLWVLPKGHIEAGEQPARTAVREVLEESGVWARVHEPLETIAFKLDGSRVKARFFLMEMLEPAKRKKRKAHPWLPGPKARSVAARKTDWKSLDDYGDLPLESHKVVEAALSRFRPQAATSAAASAARA
jgi:8-oxo-dGTP pyrophosphatase MutT (NUDIX family)